MTFTAREKFRNGECDEETLNITEILIHKSHKLIEIVYIVVEECSFMNCS
jgi:hypothetical protein